MICGFSRSVETTAGLAAAIDALVVSGRSPAELKSQIDTLASVRASDVQRYAAAPLGAADRRLAVAGVADRFADGLKAAFPALQVIHAGQLDLDQAGGLKHEAGAK